MIKETEKQEWSSLKGKIKSKFGKLSDSDIDGLNGHMDRLTSKVQKAYSYDQGKAEKECKAFNETLKNK
jgi:uncharacterized protein YjbJ (UPF0337 family)